MPDRKALWSHGRRQIQCLGINLVPEYLRRAHAHVGDIRGRGLFQGIEFVADRATKEPFDPALKLNARIKKYAFEDGLICYPGGATADGVRGDHVLLAPPYIISDEQLDELVEKLGGAIDKTFTDISG